MNVVVSFDCIVMFSRVYATEPSAIVAVEPSIDEVVSTCKCDL